MALTSPSFPSASLLLEVLEQSEETVAIVNPEGLAIYANRALTELLGLAGDEIPVRPPPAAFTRREQRPYPLQIGCGSTWFDPERPQTLDQLLAGIRLGGANLS